MVVYLRGGEYQLASTLLFDQDDSGVNGFNVIYRAYPGEKPVISGGQRITAWVPAAGEGIYKTQVRSLRFRQLYVNGKRAIRARTPNVASYYKLRSWDAGSKRIEISASEIGGWQNLNQVEIVILGKGVNQASLRIESFSVFAIGKYFEVSDAVLANNSFYHRFLRRVINTLGASAFVLPREPERRRIFEQRYPRKESRPYYFENAFEFLDEPGEWYLNTTTNEAVLPATGG